MAVNSVTSMKGRGGRFFNLRLPDPNDVFIEDVVHSLSNLCRFNGHTSPFFSVAQHSVDCAALSIIIDEENAKAAGEPIREDWKDRAWACLMHDAHEAYIGDVSSPMKIALGEAFRTFEFPIHEAVMQALKADELLKTHKIHVKFIDYKMLWSDAVRWEMDGILVGPDGEPEKVVREWVPTDFNPCFADSTPLPPRQASEAFWKTFIGLGGLERGVNSYTDWKLIDAA
jgi:hypothetical protein